MTRDEIIETALQCGVWIPIARGPEREQTIDRLQRLVGRAVAAARDKCAAICDEEADKMEQGAQRAIEDGEHDEVSAIRSTAWTLSVAASRIRKRGEE